MPSIFLAEDNAADVELFRMALAEADVDCELSVFEDGLQIIKFVRGLQQTGTSAMPDLIILDLNLPKIDGLEVVQTLRQLSAFQGVPIVVMSSSSSLRDREKLADCNIAAYIVKAPDLDEYMKIGQTIRKLLNDTPEPRL